jgi:chromosome segregation ATPase
VPAGFDLARLEAAVGQLLQRQLALQAENVALAGELEASHRRVRSLDAQLLEANQRRQDIVKHIDELISQLDELEAQVDSLGSIAFEGGSESRISAVSKSE